MAQARQKHISAIDASDQLLKLAQQHCPSSGHIRKIEQHRRALAHLRRMVMYAINNPQIDFDSMLRAQCS